MQDLIFEYATQARDSIFNRFTVVADVITFYSARSEKESLFSFSLVEFFKQSAACEGKPFKMIQHDAYEHGAIPLHASLDEQKTMHAHYQQCRLVTPDDFAFFMDQLKRFQSDPASRQKLNETPIYLQIKGMLEWARVMRSMPPSENTNPLREMVYHSAILTEAELKNYHFEIDMTSDYFPLEDIEACKASYAKFYHERQQVLESRYLQYQKDMSWSDEFAELGWNMVSSIIQSGGYAALQSGLRETLKAHGLSQNKAEWLVHATMLSVMAYANTTWYPFIFAATVLTLLKTLNELKFAKCSDPFILFSSNLAGTLTSIAQHLPMNLWGLTNLTLSLLVAIPTATVSSKISGYLTQSFWECCYGKKPENENSVAALPKPHMH